MKKQKKNKQKSQSQQQEEMSEKPQNQKIRRPKRLKIYLGVGRNVAETSTVSTKSPSLTKPNPSITTVGRNGVTISASTIMEVEPLEDNKPIGVAVSGHSLAVGNAIAGEETEYSTSNFDSKSHGTEVTTISSDADEQQTPQSNSEITTISHTVAASVQEQQRKDDSTIDSPSMLPEIGPDNNSTEISTNKLLSSIPNPLSKLAKRRQLLEARRERKAAQTLAIITGAFVVCWLPFFVMALLLPLCKSCDVSSTVSSVFLWLGYFNSTLNPVIYTVFNPEFRRAFQRIMFGRKTLPPHVAASRKL